MRIFDDHTRGWWIAVACLVAAMTPVLAGGAHASVADGAPGFCANPGPPEYYAFEMVTTRNVPGTARLTGDAQVSFVHSPFGVSVSADGSYTYDVHLALENLPVAPRGGAWAVWFTTAALDEVIYAGILEPGTPFTGRVGWNKFLTIVTLEDPNDLAVAGGPTRWAGPVVTRGMSRSGRMHTMAGHGPLQQENCAAWGYGR